MFKIKFFAYFVSILLLLTSLSSCSDKKEEPRNDRPVKRTVACYIVSENSLIGFDSLDINEMLKGDSLLMDNDELVIYLDNNKTPAIYTITNRTKGSMLSELTPEYSYPSEQNSCTGVALTEFLTYVRTHHPADSYGIIMWSHGQGWIPSVNPNDSHAFVKHRSFGIDNGKNTNENTGNQMSISELHHALATMGKPFDYIFFDCCFMQCVEVAYELRDVAKYIIGSPAEIPGTGANYTHILPMLFETTGFEKDIPLTYYNDYIENKEYGVLVSTVDCSQLNQLAEATKTILGDHSAIESTSLANVLDYFQYDLYRFMSLMNRSLPDFYDMNGIMNTVYPSSDYNKWKMAFDKAVPYAYTTKTWTSGYPTKIAYHNREVDLGQYGGMSMHVPSKKYLENSYFAQVDKYFAEGYYESQWAKDVWQRTFKSDYLNE